MRTLIIIFLTFFLTKCYSQDSASYKRYVDSILIGRSKTKVKKIKTQVDGLHIRYFFQKATRQLELIEVIQPNKNDQIWIYNYHFINGKLSRMNKYNNHEVGDRKREIAFYYLKNSKIIYREESKTQIDDIDNQLKRAEELKLNAPKY